MKAFGSRMRYHRVDKKKKGKQKSVRKESIKKKNFFLIQKRKENLIYSAHMKPYKGGIMVATKKM